MNTNSSSYLFNIELVKDGVSYSIKEYLNVFRDKFCPEIDLSIGDINFLLNKDSGFCIKEDNLPGTINLKKLIKKYDMIDGKDYVKTKEFKHSPYFLMSGYRNTYLINPKMYKKILLLSNSKFVEYYLFLEQSINAYQEYQNLYIRETIIQKDEKIKELNNMLYEKELQLTKMRNSVNIFNQDINYLEDDI